MKFDSVFLCLLVTAPEPPFYHVKKLSRLIGYDRCMEIWLLLKLRRHTNVLNQLWILPNSIDIREHNMHTDLQSCEKERQLVWGVCADMLCIMTKHLHFGLVCPNDIVPEVCGLFRCNFTNLSCAAMFFLLLFTFIEVLTFTDNLCIWLPASDCFLRS